MCAGVQSLNLGLKPQLCHLLAHVTLAIHLPFLGLSFLICEVEIVIPIP